MYLYESTIFMGVNVLQNALVAESADGGLAIKQD